LVIWWVVLINKILLNINIITFYKKFTLFESVPFILKKVD